QQHTGAATGNERVVAGAADQPGRCLHVAGYFEVIVTSVAEDDDATGGLEGARGDTVDGNHHVSLAVSAGDQDGVIAGGSIHDQHLAAQRIGLQPGSGGGGGHDVHVGPALISSGILHGVSEPIEADVAEGGRVGDQ